jgi:hypothetical protein
MERNARDQSAMMDALHMIEERAKKCWDAASITAMCDCKSWPHQGVIEII